MAIKCEQLDGQHTIAFQQTPVAATFSEAGPEFPPIAILYSSFDLPTAQIESAFPIKNATKQIPNTEWSNEAPKYCHIGAPAPGKSDANNNVTINSNPNALARRTQTPNVNAIPIANSPYATRKAIGRACGSTNPRKIGAMNGYAPPCKNLLIQNSNPPCKVNCVPKTLYCPKIKNNIPTQIRKNASARSFPR